ncbi:histidine kinase [Actinoplanes sp. NPDC049802]|uniref:histidine kinase n=1 Tax=Actinoplanes sp. NPDC049802 TaxID=3154742 RepID=UPI0033EED6F3
MTGRSGTRMSPERRLVLLGIVGGAAACQALAALGLWHEPENRRILLGTVGLIGFTAALADALYRSLTPRSGRPTDVRRLLGLAVLALSVPLVGPVGDERWPTWGFLGAALVGVAPVLLPMRSATVLAVVTVLVSAASARWYGHPAGVPVAVTIALGLPMALSSGLQLWFGARMEERDATRRIAWDSHRVLGDLLSAIILKAELASRLAPADPERAGREMAEVRAIAAAALARLRTLVHDQDAR